MTFDGSPDPTPDGSDDPGPDHSPTRTLIAHRGASAYAPEHTLVAYRMAIEQGADFIEPDLQITRDGVLVCLHDLTLERTTDVEEVFPDRFRAQGGEGEEDGEDGEGDRAFRHWYVSDFTLAEVRRLDAGRWFEPRFQGARVPTLAEAIDLARGRAGIYPETKAPEVYGRLGFSMERLLIEVLESRSLVGPEADPSTPLVVQSFSEQSLRILRGDLGLEVPMTFLISATDPGPVPADLTGAASPGDGTAGSPGTWLAPQGLAEIARFASGVGPAKVLLLDRPGIVAEAHAAGLEVVPWTFRSDATGEFPDVQSEMAHFLYELGVDGLFTDHPDQFPRHPGHSTLGRTLLE